MKGNLLCLTAVLLSGLVFIGCGGSSDQTAEDTTTTKSVTVIDGRVDGAFVFADCNGDRKFDTGEPYTHSVKGIADLKIPATCSYKEIIAVMDNATDIDFNTKVNGALIASANASIVSPITTLLAVDSNVKETLENLGIKDPETFNYVEEWGNITDSAKALIAGTIGAINIVGKSIEDEKIEAIAELTNNLSENLIKAANVTNSTNEIVDSVVDAIQNVKLVANETLIANETIILSNIQDLTTAAINSGSIGDLAEAVNDTVSFLYDYFNETVNETLEIVNGTFDSLNGTVNGTLDSLNGTLSGGVYPAP